MKRIQWVFVISALAAALAGADEPRAPQGGLVPFRPAGPLTDAPPSCTFDKLQLPQDFAVFAAGGGEGRKLAFRIDDSDGPAQQMDVAVNYPAKPVVLLLGAYGPTIWNIGWTRGTRILAVVATGYQRQAIAGLEPDVPTIVSTHQNGGPCEQFYGVQNDAKLNPLARRLFGRGVDLAYPMPRGSAVIGERVLNPAELLSSPAVTVDSYRDRNAALVGRAGLEEAVRKGILRPAAQADAQAWDEARWARKRDVPPVAGGSPPRPRAALPRNAYVVLKAFDVPPGLTGSDTASFFVPKGAPRPTNPRNCDVYDFNTLECSGFTCQGGP